ncbi:FdhF/YdeP family oxidoreductase [Streptomyces sp. NPDC098789]|uniref:FdhF/YdeP family oxidoreductase n=1 Tax=Streptomyces sp. NPDC098789 TaxID=3366098 RepID=UPI0037F9CA63
MAVRAPGSDPAQDAPRITEPSHHAVGVHAVTTAMRLAQRQMGVLRSARTLLRVNQSDGFDCPGCAWPEEDRVHRAEFCENGAKAVAEEATRRRVTPAFFAEHAVADLLGRSGYWLGQQGRLTHPMLLDDGATHYVPVSWERAYEIIGEEFAALDSPDEAVFYTSGRTPNEPAFALQLLARRLGTNNLPDCANMCHEATGDALVETLGVGKGSVSLEDIHHADLVIVAGQNPGTNHPRMMAALEQTKGNGGRIISVNPLPEAGLERFKNPQRPRGVLGDGTKLTDLFLQIRTGGDLALFRALNQLLLRAEDEAPGTVLDRAFIAEHTLGFEAWERDARATERDDVLAATGLPMEQIEAAARMVLESKSVIVCWALGLTQHKHSVPTLREIVNFLLLRGNVGRPGAGVCPVRGHSNVQGDRTMGIYERPTEAFHRALGEEFGFTSPRHHGYDSVGAIKAMRDGEVKVFVGMGGNFAAAAPDTPVTEEALRRCSLTVQISTKPNRSHLITGRRALILPTLGRSDEDRTQAGPQFVTVEDSMGRVHASRGRLKPEPMLRSETSIVCAMARAALGPGDDVPWEEFAADHDRLRDRIERVVPGFDDFNARVRRPGGFVLPHAPRDARSFPTHTGRANFTVNDMVVLDVPEGRLLLQTLRSHDQYNTTIYGLDDRYRGVHEGRRVVLVSPADITALGVTEGSFVDLVSEWPDGRERRAAHFKVVSYPTARGCAAAYMPEATVLVPLDHTSDISNTPAYKSVVIRFEPDSGPAAVAVI